MNRIGLAAALGVVALVTLAATLWFLGDALMLWIEANAFSPPAAAGLTGLAGIAAIVVLGLLAKWTLHPKRRPALPPAHRANGVANGIAADLGALAAQQIVSTTRAHPYGTVGAALAAGLAFGVIPELRNLLNGMWKH